MIDNILISLSVVFLVRNINSNEINDLTFKSDRLLAGCASAAEHVVRLRGDANEGRTLGNFLEVGCADIGHHRAYTPQDLAHRAVDRTAVGGDDRLAFGGAVTGDA